VQAEADRFELKAGGVRGPHLKSAGLSVPRSAHARRRLIRPFRASYRSKPQVTKPTATAGFIAPAVVVVVALMYLPFLYSVYISFTNYDGLGSPRWDGIANYVQLFHDPEMVDAIRNTAVWVVAGVVVPVALGLGLAILTYGIRHGGWYRLPFLLPYAMSGAGVAVIWGFILQPGGALGDVLKTLGLPGSGTAWLSYWPDSTIAMVIASAWQATGVNCLLFVVGLQAVPVAVLEAAEIDGARAFTKLWRVTLPLLRPMTIVVVGLAIVAALKTFDIVWVMTQGGPGYTSTTLATAMYSQTFVADSYGYGAAIAVLLTVVTGLASAVYLKQQVQVGGVKR